MKVRSIDTLDNNRIVEGKGFTSFRFLLKKDKMGFGVHKTVIPKGGPYLWHYKNHLEACYCICGEGELINLDTNIRYKIRPDTIYILDKNDRHTFEAITDVELISVFNPPLNGFEVHKNDGSYEL